VLAGLEHASEHVPGVRGVENLRARWMGHRLYAEADMIMDPNTQVSAVKAAADVYRREAMVHMPALESLRIGVSDASGHLVEDDRVHQHAGPRLVSGPNARLIDTGHGLHVLELHEHGTSSRWRFRPERGKPWGANEVTLMTERADGRQQTFTFAEQNGFIESLENVPEPHNFSVHLNLGHGDHSHGFEFPYGAGEDPSKPITRLH